MKQSIRVVVLPCCVFVTMQGFRLYLSISKFRSITEVKREHFTTEDQFRVKYAFSVFIQMETRRFTFVVLWNADIDKYIQNPAELWKQSACMARQFLEYLRGLSTTRTWNRCYGCFWGILEFYWSKKIIWGNLEIASPQSTASLVTWPRTAEQTFLTYSNTSPPNNVRKGFSSVINSSTRLQI